MPTTEPSVLTRVAEIYERHPHHILPYVGEAFITPTDLDLRVLTVGINSYVSEKDWPPNSEWHRVWYEKRSHRFQTRLFQEVGILASVLSATPMFRGLRYDDRRCLYATNGVKVYVPENRGKRAAHLEAGDFDAHEQQWRDELKLLAEEGAMPHVVIIFSQVYWEYAWKAFHPKHGGPALGVSDFEPISGDAPHRLNRITITREGREHPLLLVRLLHPTGGRGDVGTAEWLTERKAFQSAVGNTDTE